MFTIVTHYSPDLDAISSVWLIRKFLPNWADAVVAFVPAGKTLNNEIPDSNPHILHVDTGFGMLDHHQSNENTCAAKKTYAYLMTHISKNETWEDEAVVRICDMVNFYDHFGEVKLKDINADYHVFDTVTVVDGLKSIYFGNDQKIMDLGMEIIDGVYKSMQEKIWAEEILNKEGIEFMSPWGKGIGFETLNDSVLKLGQKSGYILTVRKDPKKGYVRIKAMPDNQVDLTEAYEIFKKMDPQATWFLHSSKAMLLNGSVNNLEMKPTKLTLKQIIDVLKTKKT